MQSRTWNSWSFSAAGFRPMGIVLVNFERFVAKFQVLSTGRAAFRFLFSTSAASFHPSALEYGSADRGWFTPCMLRPSFWTRTLQLTPSDVCCLQWLTTSARTLISVESGERSCGGHFRWSVVACASGWSSSCERELANWIQLAELDKRELAIQHCKGIEERFAYFVV